MSLTWTSGTEGFRRAFQVRDGYDCRTTCEHEKKGEHGWHADDWHYIVSDARGAMSITVFSGEFAKRPELTKEWRASFSPIAYVRSESRLMVADMSVHIPCTHVELTADDHECEFVEGGRCTVIWTSTLWAHEFWTAHADDRQEQDEMFWHAMELKYQELRGR